MLLRRLPYCGCSREGRGEAGHRPPGEVRGAQAGVPRTYTLGTHRRHRPDGGGPVADSLRGPTTQPARQPANLTRMLWGSGVLLLLYSSS